MRAGAFVLSLAGCSRGPVNSLILAQTKNTRKTNPSVALLSALSEHCEVQADWGRDFNARIVYLP